jgi:hypothetical protein
VFAQCRKNKLAATSDEFANNGHRAQIPIKIREQWLWPEGHFAEYNDSHAEWQVSVTVLQVSNNWSGTNARTTAGYLFCVLQPPRTTQFLTGIS